jgi:serine protease Do
MFPNQEGEEGEGGGEIEVPSSGSGFIIDASGYVFTNDHVVAGAEHLTVSLADGRVYAAWLVGTDPLTDVAVVKIDLPAGDPPLPVIQLGDSDEIRVGDWSIAVGNPLGELEGTLTVGVVSAKGRRNLRIVGGGPVYQDFIQTDASINFGNSGGPLVNGRGEAIGINSAVNPTGQGLGFAIPINMARRVGIELIGTGTVRRGYLGILPQEVTEDIREAWEMPSLAGILVGSVEGDTPAERAGLKVGDVILEFNENPLPDVPAFRSIVAEAGVGVDVPILFLRDGEQMKLNVVLDERPDTPTPPLRHPEPVEGDWLGAEIENINAGLVERMDLQVDAGVVVTEMNAGGAAARGGLRVGDVILEVNRSEVATKKELDRELDHARESKKPVVFLVRRGTTTTFVAVRAQD